MGKYYQRPEIVNSFQLGLRQDRDPLIQDPRSYRDSLNGRLLFNQSGNYAWVIARGNKSSFFIKPGYRIIGGCEMPDKWVVFSTNETYSEIAIVVIDANDNASYTTIFNDLYDPNGDRLHFSFTYPIRAWAVIDSQKSQRVYWTDGNREMYTINVVAGLQQNNPEFTSGNYLPIGGYAPGNVYPWFYSVQQFQWYTDVRMGRIKFNRRIGTVSAPEGSLKTGVFQYAYRYGTREGYWTPFAPLTRGIMLTNIDLAPTNSHDYYMVNSNVTTPYAIELDLDGIDDRYYYLQVAYIYSVDYNATVESNIFFESKISDLTIIGDNVTVTHRDHSGIPVNIDGYNVYPVFIERTKDIIEKDQRLWFPNVKTDGEYLIDVSEVKIEPYIRTYVGDNLEAQTTPPLTQVSIEQTTVSVRQYIDKNNTDVVDTYVIDGDYVNYKGMQFEHLFKGYWRGETYPFGIVWFNRKGIPFYVQNLKDVTFPEQYDDDGGFPPTTYTLTDDNYKLKIMGAMVSGIRVDDGFLYDSFGNLRVSGFAIVRCIRKPKTLYQAVLANTVYAKDGGDEKKTFPLVIASNKFSGFFATDSIEYDDRFLRSAGVGYGSRGNTYTVHSPELYFNFNVYGQTGQDGLVSSDVLKIVSVTQSAYEKSDDCSGRIIELYGGTIHNQLYSKQYITSSDVGGTYPMGAMTTIETINRIDFSNSESSPDQFILPGYDPQNLTLEFHGSTLLYMDDCICSGEFHALAGRDSYLFKTKDWLQPATFAQNNVSTYYLVNYVAASTRYYNEFNSESIGTRKYIGTGHFQRIDESVLASVKRSDGTYLFNGIEVWGGDCYVEFFDFLRIYPRYDGNCATQCGGDYYVSYSVGMVTPIESNLNHAMRKGRSFASVAVETEQDACGVSNNTLTGINVNQPEEFNVNSVLLYQENVQFFPGLPSETDVVVNEFPNRWVYTPVKFYGELTDNYRRVLANNYGDVIGLYGDIQGGILWNNQLYSFQQSGWGRLRINDRSIITTQNEEAVTTGAGETFDGIDYFSHNYGTQDIFSLVSTERAIYWVDVINRSLMRYGGAGQEVLSDTKEMHDFSNYILNFYDVKVRSVVPFQYRFISVVYDKHNGEIIYSFANNIDNPTEEPATISLVFNENIDAFTTKNSFYPVFISSYRHFVFSADNNDMASVWMHNAGDPGSYYGNVYDSYIEPVINPVNNLSKHFDNVILNITEDGADSLVSIQFETDTQGFTQPAFQSYARKEYRFGQLKIALPITTDGKRLTGKFMKMKMFFSNLDGKFAKLMNMKTFWRLNRFAG